MNQKCEAESSDIVEFPDVAVIDIASPRTCRTELIQENACVLVLRCWYDICLGEVAYH